jgi:predicted PurR-regulated permease PerM
MPESGEHISFSKSLSLSAIRYNFSQYLLGSITLAIVTGLVTGLITFLLLKLFKKKTRLAR